MEGIRRIFTPDHVRYEGVRPINIYLLRLFYFLMVFFVATDAWSGILTHEGPMDRYRAMALSVWAAYATMAVLGLIHPLRMLPIMVFMIFYKTLWLFVAAYPLWRAGTLAGSPAEEMASVFMMAPFLALIIPWKYFVQNFVMLPRNR